MYDLICIGTALIDSVIKGFDPEPVSASGFRAESGSLSAGGEAVNASMAAAKLGLKTGILMSAGNDPAGDLIVSTLEKAGVDTALTIRSDDHATPVTTMFVNDDGSRKSITNGSHRYNFHPERYKEKLADAKAIAIGSLFRAPFDDPDIIHEVVSAAKEKGTLVFADTKLPNFRKLSLRDIRDALPLIDCITPNEDEAKYYTGKADPADMAETFLEMGVGSVIIKLGAKGCFFSNREHSVSLPAYEINAADATGAGDNFLAGFISEILRGSAPAEALRFANACGAICATAVGAGTALKSRAQVLKFIRTAR